MYSLFKNEGNFKWADNTAAAPHATEREIDEGGHIPDKVKERTMDRGGMGEKYKKGRMKDLLKGVKCLIAFNMALPHSFLLEKR